MSKNYRIKREENLFYIHENPTEQKIERYPSFREASLRVVDLERGEAFGECGWTPYFFTTSVRGILENLETD